MGDIKKEVPIFNSEKNVPKMKTILFCLSGTEFKSRFLLNWSDILLKCIINNFKPVLCLENDKNIFISRNKCLGANLLNDEEQLPYQGKLDYDYLVWIDQCVTFTFDDLLKLMKSPYDVTTGVYMFNNTITNLVHKFDYEFYKENRTFNFINYDSLVKAEKEDNRYLEVEFADMGFFMLKKGVSEKISYPWFEHNTDEPVSLFTDSYSYCKKLLASGVKIMVDSNIKMNYIE
jgi:hypothetical protein